MSQKSLLTFAITLILASSGCLDFGDNKLEQQENDDNEKQEPVGETNMTSLEKRIEHLESTIAEYEQPRVYFVNASGYSYTSPSLEYHLSDDGYLLCTYYEYYERMMCSINALYYDANGLVTSYSWEGSEAELENLTIGGLCQADTEPIICRTTTGSTSSHWTDVCKFGEVNQRLTLTVYDNDGNSASASYDLDYDSVCIFEGPDNEGGTDFCDDDGEEKIEGGMIWSCIEGEWEAMASIVCGSNEFVSNHTCVPCPGNTTNEAGDPAPLSDTTCDENHPPIIWSFALIPENITEETTLIYTNLNATDPEGSSLSISADVYLNGQMVDQAFSELLVSFVFDLSEYNILSGDGIHVYVTVMDDSGQSATEDYFVIVEEESED